jgi:hypothetical protein
VPVAPIQRVFGAAVAGSGVALERPDVGVDGVQGVGPIGEERRLDLVGSGLARIVALLRSISAALTSPPA